MFYYQLLIIEINNKNNIKTSVHNMSQTILIIIIDGFIAFFIRFNYGYF